MLKKVKPEKLAEFLLVSGIAKSKEQAKVKAEYALFNFEETEFTTSTDAAGFDRMNAALGNHYEVKGIRYIWNLEGLGRITVFDYKYGSKTVKVQSVTETNNQEKV